MPRSRTGHAAVVIDGRVVLYGGTGSTSGPALRVVDAYDPMSRRWEEVGNTLHDFTSFTATALATGEVLLIEFAAAECHSPSTGQSRRVAAPPTPRYGHAAVLDGRGRVVLAGGDGRGDLLRTVEVYEPSSGWHEVGPLAVGRLSPTAVGLADGRVLIAGGSDGSPRGVADTEVFDPARSVWATTAPTGVPRMGHTLTLLPDGSVLAIGGALDESAPWHDSVERFDREQRRGRRPVAFAPVARSMLLRQFRMGGFSSSVMPTLRTTASARYSIRRPGRRPRSKTRWVPRAEPPPRWWVPPSSSAVVTSRPHSSRGPRSERRQARTVETAYPEASWGLK